MGHEFFLGRICKRKSSLDKFAGEPGPLRGSRDQMQIFVNHNLVQKEVLLTKLEKSRTLWTAHMPFDGLVPTHICQHLQGTGGYS